MTKPPVRHKWLAPLRSAIVEDHADHNTHAHTVEALLRVVEQRDSEVAI